jgi:hypothetical protein
MEAALIRRWIAREWLYLLGGLVWAYVLSPFFIRALAQLALSVWPRLYPPIFDALVPFIAFGPYVLYQGVRITMWAIRTVREPPR